MASTNDFRRGMVLDIDGRYYSILEFQHVNPGKGAAFVRSKLKDVLQGKVLEKTWRAGEKVQDIRLERRVFQLLYHTDDMYTVMDPDSFEQIDLSTELIGDAVNYLTDGSDVDVLFVGDKPIMVEPPISSSCSSRNPIPGLRVTPPPAVRNRPHWKPALWFRCPFS